MKEYDESIRCFSKVIELAKETSGEYGLANAYYQRAFSNWNAGNKDESCNDFTKAKSLGIIFNSSVEESFIKNCK